jgi:DNA-directed RNA polymerase subunit E'/Rpb7
MLITKVLETSVDLIDPNSEIYAPDLESIILNILKNRYVGKCYNSILIVEIKKIIKKSLRKFVDNRLDGGASVDVCFEVEGHVFSTGEILHGCSIVETLNNAITAENKYAGIKLQKNQHNETTSNKILQSLSQKQIIPIIIQNVRYNLNKPKVSIIGSPYTPVYNKFVMINIVEGLNPAQFEKISYLLNQIKIEEELHLQYTKGTEDKRYTLFKSIMYPFKSLQKIDQSKEFTNWKMKPISFDLNNKKDEDNFTKEILEISSGTIVYPDEDHKLNRRMFYSPDEIKSNFHLSVDANLYSVLSDILYKFLLYMIGLRGFLETYQTLEQANQLSTYLKICKANQIE